MDETILRVLRGDATPEEEERLAEWCGESPENQGRFDAVQAVFRATHAPPAHGSPDPSAVPRIIRIAEERSAREPVGATGLRRWALPLAAALAAISLGVAYLSQRTVPRPALEAPAGSSETFVLPDGSLARLSAGSRLLETGGEGERHFALEGRALFAVTHDEARPFLVDVGGVRTRVLGTRFEAAERAGGGARVAVLEGRVEVSGGRGRAEVEAGEISVASPDAPPSVSRPDDLLGMLDWAEGTLLFRDTPLAAVASEVERRYGVPVLVEGDALRNTRISAWFAAEPFREVVESLCAATGATCTVSDTVAVLR